MVDPKSHRREVLVNTGRTRFYPAVLAALFALQVIALGIAPLDREAWILENIPGTALFIILVLSHRKLPFSNLSYTLIFVFMSLHEIGSHYTYSLVPYDAWFNSAFGTTLNQVMGWERNHYDRLLHFLYGLLLAYPLREFFFRVADAKGFWDYYIPLNVVMATSLIYELIEWGAAVVFGGEVGAAYLGTQGDIWDAQWDMALATLGAMLALAITFAFNLCYQKDFQREWRDSLAVKHSEPVSKEQLMRRADQ
jgi:putative membrane protein